MPDLAFLSGPVGGALVAGITSVLILSVTLWHQRRLEDEKDARALRDARRERLSKLFEGLRKHFYQLCELAGVPRVRFHDLRHTHATLLLAQDVHPKVVSERLGHSKIGITLDTYSHVTANMQELAARQLDTLLAAVGS